MNKKKYSEIECYDVSVSLGEFAPEKKNQMKLTITYEYFRHASRQPCVGLVFDDDGKEIIQFLPAVTVQKVFAMNNLVIYPGGGGPEQTDFIHDVRAIYLAMRDDPMQQRIKGFGRWEFLKFFGTSTS